MSQVDEEFKEEQQPAPAEAGEQLEELKAQLEAEAGVKEQLLEHVHHLETQVRNSPNIVHCAILALCFPVAWQNIVCPDPKATSRRTFVVSIVSNVRFQCVVAGIR